MCQTYGSFFLFELTHLLPRWCEPSGVQELKAIDALICAFSFSCCPRRQGATTMTTLASAGSSGKHAGNIFRSLAWNSCCHPQAARTTRSFDTAWTAGLLKRAFFGDYDTCADFWNSAEDRQHLRQNLCHRGHSAATPSKMVFVVLHAPKLAARGVLEQLVWLRNTTRWSGSSSR